MSASSFRCSRTRYQWPWPAHGPVRHRPDNPGQSGLTGSSLRGLLLHWHPVLGHEPHAVLRQPQVGIIPQHRQSQPEPTPVQLTSGHSSMADRTGSGHKTQNHAGRRVHLPRDREMIKEVLDVILGLARSKMTLLVATHQTGFACEVADHLVFMDADAIVEVATPNTFFDIPEDRPGQSVPGTDSLIRTCPDCTGRSPGLPPSQSRDSTSGMKAPAALLATPAFSGFRQSRRRKEGRGCAVPDPIASRERPGGLAQGPKPMTNVAVRHKGAGTPYRVRG